MKYIDAEKLIAEIERLQKRAEDLEELSLTVGERSYWSGGSGVLALLTQFINSLQREQPERTCKTCDYYENDCPFTRGKFIVYPNKVCKDYIHSAMKEQEQPEVVKVFSRPFLPSNLDEAANDYCSAYYDWDNEGERKEVVRTFKSGAEWMAGQFQKIEGDLVDWYETNGVDYCHGISTNESFEVPEGFYIRKK